MQVREIMTPHPEYLLSTSSICEAAKKMSEIDSGFLPIGDKTTDKLIGTITDRDIVISALAQGKDLNTSVKEVMHEGICYCFETDDIKDATRKMQENQIRRLVVLNEDKRLTGVISLGDVALNCPEELSGETLEEVSKH